MDVVEDEDLETKEAKRKVHLQILFIVCVNVLIII